MPSQPLGLGKEAHLVPSQRLPYYFLQLHLSLLFIIIECVSVYWCVHVSAGILGDQRLPKPLELELWVAVS